MPPRIFISCARAPTKLASPFRTVGSEVAMALRDTLSLQHLMRFRRRSATSVVDASENFYILRSCAHRTRITLPDRWQRRRNGFTRHVELPASNAFSPLLSNTRGRRRVDCAAHENFWQRSRNGLTRLRSCAHKVCGCLREFLYSHHPSGPLAAKSQWPYATRGASST